MKRPHIILIFILFMFSFNGLNLHAFENEEVVPIEKLFLYLKEGNTTGILNLLTDPLLTEKKEIFENNQSYSNFMINTYEESSLSISKIEQLSDLKSAINVEIRFRRGGPPLKTRFILKKEEGVWKISEEILTY